MTRYPLVFVIPTEAKGRDLQFYGPLMETLHSGFCTGNAARVPHILEFPAESPGLREFHAPFRWSKPICEFAQLNFRAFQIKRRL